MNLQMLIQGLNDPQPAIRLNVVRLIGMVEETHLLDSIRERFKAETDSTVKAALEWAGKRLYQANQSGYSTLDAIFTYFNIDRELANAPGDKEAELMKKMQSDMERDLMRMQNESNAKRVGLAAGAALGGMLAGGLIGGTAMASAAVSSTMSTADVTASNLGLSREHLSNSRTPPPVPSTVDIKVWLKRLREDPDPAMRKKAAQELGNLNNTAALPHLATSFTSDAVADVRQTAERAGKILYWGAVYWQITQDGSLDQEIARRRLTGVQPKQDIRATQSMQVVQPKEDDIAAILRRTEEKRKSKKK